MQDSGTISVAAGARSANQLLGLPSGMLVGPAEISVVANHPGAAASDIRTHYMSGVQAVTGANGALTNVAATAGVLDPRFDTVLAREPVIGNQSLIFENTTAGALVVSWKVVVHED